MNREDERVLSLHQKSIFINALDYFPVVADAGYFDKLITAGVTADCVTVIPTNATPLQALRGLKHWYEVFEEHSDKIIKVTTARDIEKAKREDKTGIVMGSQQAEIIGDDISLLRIYKELGLRIIQLSYYMQTPFGEGFNERTNGGLTTFGVEVVEEMNRLGLLVDVSHCKDQVTMDAIKFSKVPVVATHSNPRGLANFPRNKTDEQIKAMAEKGGVIGIAGFTPMSEVREGVFPELEDFLNLIDYTIKLVGPDHVGIGLDLTPVWSEEAFEEWAKVYPVLRPKWGFKGRNIFNKEGYDDISQVPEITKGLVARGYSEPDIQKIIGLNFLRVFREVWGE